jgi:hypothetical protein
MLSRTAYVIVGVIVVVLSLGATLFTLNLWSGYPVSTPAPTTPPIQPTAASAPAPVAAIAPGSAPETSLDELPKMTALGFRWAGIAHLNVQAETEASVVTGQSILHLLPTSQDGYHTLAGQFSGLTKGQAYRVTAWIKPDGVASFELEASDRPNGQPLNYAVGVFDLAHHKVLSGSGATNDRGIELDPSGWQKVWLDLLTANGVIAVTIRPTDGGQITFKGDGTHGIILGGVEADPRG